MWLAVIVLSLVAVATAVGLALVQARRLAAPMERLAARVGRVAEPGVSVEAHPTGISELDAIGAALADADRRVEDVLRREREFSDNASHRARSSTSRPSPAAAAPTSTPPTSPASSPTTSAASGARGSRPPGGS